MTPKEKAKELVKTYYNTININQPECSLSFSQCKVCALIAVDEILQELPQYMYGHPILVGKQEKYWQEVKTEIQAL